MYIQCSLLGALPWPSPLVLTPASVPSRCYPGHTGHLPIPCHFLMWPLHVPFPLPGMPSLLPPFAPSESSPNLTSSGTSCSQTHHFTPEGPMNLFFAALLTPAMSQCDVFLPHWTGRTWTEPGLCPAGSHHSIGRKERREGGRWWRGRNTPICPAGECS